MLTPSPRSNLDTAALPQWVRELSQSYGTAREDACAIRLLSAIAADDPDNVYGIAIVEPKALNQIIPGSECHAVTQAFSEGKIKVAAAILERGGDWPALSESPFTRVVLEEGLETAVNRLVLLNREIRNKSVLDDSFPRISSIDHATLLLITKFDEAFKYIKGCPRQSTIELKSLIIELLDSSEPLKRLEEIVDAVTYVAGLKFQRAQQDPAPLTKSVIRALRGDEIDLLCALVKCVDEFVYDANKPLRIHPSQSDLMLLLNHPLIAKSKERLDLVSEALTATDVFALKGIASLSEHIVLSVFARIGRHTYGFQRFKYDSRPSEYFKTSLLEEFGFQRVQKPPRQEIFGACFTYSAPDDGVTIIGNDHIGQKREFFLDPQTFFVLRRSGIGIHHPEFGSAWIRNSSLVFGRDTMASPALYSPKEAKSKLSPERLHNPYNLANHEIFFPVASNDLNNFCKLLDQLDALIEYDRAWKFDTNRYSAWRETPSGEYEAKGLYLSPGFVSIVDRLSDWFDQAHRHGRNVSITVPSIGFVPAAHLPFTYYSGSGDLEKFNGIAMTHRNLALLQQLASGDWDSELLESNFWAFINDAGANREGELVLRDPEPGKEIE